MFTKQEEIINKFIKKHGYKFDYSKVIYENWKTKVIIICPVHGEFFQTPKDHLSGRGCPNCKKSKLSFLKTLTQEEFIRKCILRHGYKYNYNKVIYVNSWTKVIITCPIHGDFEQISNHHLQGHGCSKCGFINISLSKFHTTEEFIQKARKIHGWRYDYSNVIYNGDNEKVIIICHEHGEFEQTPSDHLQGKGCIKCRNKLLSKKFSHTTEQFIEKARKVHGNKYDYSKVIYINDRTKVIIICPIHGEFEQISNHHLRSQGCSKCKMSKGEKALDLIFKKHNIEAKLQTILPYHTYEYDFYLPEYNVFVEFHGVQHYEPVNHFGGINEYKEIQKRDLFKKNLARDYNIPLIEIHYKNLELPKEQFEELILNILKRIKNRKFKSWFYFKVLNKDSKHQESCN